MAAVQLPLALVPALPQWVAPQLKDLPWILLVGTAGLTAHFCLTRAVRIADATLVVPIDFLRLPLIAVVGMLFYGEPLELPIMLGAAVIFAGTFYSIRRESTGRPASFSSRSEAAEGCAGRRPARPDRER